jgi:hypothetical protein
LLDAHYRDDSLPGYVTFDIDGSRKSYGPHFFSGSLAFLVPIRAIDPFIFFVALESRGSRRLRGAIWQVGSNGSYGSIGGTGSLSYLWSRPSGWLALDRWTPRQDWLVRLA